MILKRDFYNRSADKVAHDLVGKYLITKSGSKITTGLITEVEAYLGPHDKACHAYKGRTRRTEVMYGPPGKAYIFLIYGMHYCLNFVTDRLNYPSAVLVRSVDLRGVNGPGQLTKKFKINLRHNGIDITCKKYGLWVEDGGFKINKFKISSSPRIGVDYALEWSNKPYRFKIVK